MNKILFIADLFFSDGFIGGAERCNDTLIKEFFNQKYNDYKDYMFITMNCSKITPEIINKNLDSKFFICNFMTLSQECKDIFVNKKLDYIIVEYDHKYIKSNDPSIYPNFLSNEEGLQNINFYKNAKAVLCQSTYACEILYKNLLLNNIINLKGNLWSEKDIFSLRTTLKNSSTPENRKNEWAVLNTNNKNKGVSSTINYCLINKIKYNFIGNSNYKDFIKEISESKGVIFFPKWVETFNRFLIEARALNCKVMTNKKVGCVRDNWMKYKGTDLLDQMEIMKDKIFQIYDDLIQENNVEFYNVDLPRITIMTTFVEAETYIEDFLETVIAQTIFEDVDLFIYDAASTGREAEIISSYQEKYPNIIHIRDEEKIGSSEAFNRMIQKSKNEFIGMISIDDRPAPHYAEKLRKYLNFSNTDLVYGDCVQTYEENTKITDDFYTNNNLYEHSLNDFSPENMIKSLPGPMPMFKKSMIDKSGAFDINFKHSNDWELWLRCVRDGATFYKVHDKIGLYYFNPNGVTTSPDTFKSKIKEEASLFEEYKDILGEDNYKKYKQYFSQGL